MPDFNKIQQNSISEWRQLHQNNGGMVLSDEAVVSSMLMEFFATGKIYPGFEELVKTAPTEKGESIFPLQPVIRNEVPIWQAKLADLNLSPTQQKAMDFLRQMTQDASRNMELQERRDGWDNDIANFFKECFKTEYAKSNVNKAISSTQKDIYALENAARQANVSQISFEEVFYKQRGVEFDIKQINLCDEKAKAMADVQSVRDCINRIKGKLDNALVNNIGNAIAVRDYGNGKISRTQGEFAIIDTLQFLGITNQGDINRLLSEIESQNAETKAFSKYGKDIRLEKDDKGNWVINVTNASGERSPMLQEHAQVIGKELNRKLTLVYAENIGAEYREDMTTEELDKITTDLYNKYKSEYEESFQKAYGKKDLKALSQNYMMSQQQLATWVNVASFATMFVGSGIPLKGIQYLNAAAQGTRLAATTAKAVAIATDVTQTAEKLMPLLMVNQVAQPVQLLHNLTSDEPDWKAYGMSVAEGSMWMLLGMASGVLGDKARLFLKEKGLSFIAKNSGMSIDDLMSVYRSGQQIPANLTQAFKMIETVALASGSSVEFVADVMLTSVVNKAVYGADITTMEKLMSLNGVLLGAAMQRKNIAKSNEMKQSMFEIELRKYCPDLEAAEITSRAKMLVELSAIAEDKLKARPKIFEGVEEPKETGVYSLTSEEVMALNKKTSEVEPAVQPENNVEKVFDSQNRISKEITKDANGSVVEQVNYLYGSDGTLVAKDMENLLGKFRTVYSSDGKVFRDISYLDGKEHIISEYSYSDGNKYTITTKKVGEDTPHRVEFYEGGKITQSIEQVIPWHSPNSKRTVTTTYDEAGQRVERITKYSDEPNKTTVEKFNGTRLVSTDNIVDYVKETARQDVLKYADAVNKIHENNYENVSLLRDFSPEERQWFIDNPLKKVSDSDVFILFANGDKPSSLLPIAMPDSIIEKFKAQGVDIVNRNMWGDVTNSFLLNPVKVKKVIEANYEIYSNRMNMKGAGIDDIYAKLVSEDSPLKFEEQYPDLIGLTLGFPKKNTLIYNLENQLKDFKFSNRFNDDISEYKELLKAALYAEESPYSGMSEEFKSDLAAAIDGMDKVTRSGEALYGDEITRSPYQFINYVNDSWELNRVRNSTIAVSAAVRKGEPISLIKPTQNVKDIAQIIRDKGDKSITAVGIMEECAKFSPVEAEKFIETLKSSWYWNEKGFSIEQATLAAKLPDEEFIKFRELLGRRSVSKDYEHFDFCYNMAKLSKEDFARVENYLPYFKEPRSFDDYKKLLDFNDDMAVVSFMRGEIPMLHKYSADEDMLFDLLDRGADLNTVNKYLAGQEPFNWRIPSDLEEDKKLLVDILSNLNEENFEVFNAINGTHEIKTIMRAHELISYLADKKILDFSKQMIASDNWSLFEKNGLEKDFFETLSAALVGDDTFAWKMLEKDIFIPELLLVTKDSDLYKEIVLSLSERIIETSDYKTKENVQSFKNLRIAMSKFEKDIPPDVIKEVFNRVFSKHVNAYERRNFIKQLDGLNKDDLTFVTQAEDMDMLERALNIHSKSPEVGAGLKDIYDTITKYDVYFPTPENIMYIKEFEKTNQELGREVFSKGYLSKISRKNFKSDSLKERIASTKELLLKHDNLCITAKTLSLLDYHGAKDCLSILSDGTQTPTKVSAWEIYDQTFAKFADRASQFGCKNMQELEGYIKTATFDRAAAGKLMGEIKKTTLDDFLNSIPLELQAFLIGKNGTFTAKDFENALVKINNNPDLGKLLEYAKTKGELPVSAKLYAAAILADSPEKFGVWENYYEKALSAKESAAENATTKEEAELIGINLDEIPDNPFELSPEMRANFTQFGKKFEYGQACFDIFWGKLKQFAEAHGRLAEFEEAFAAKSEDLFEAYVQMSDCADIIGESHFTMLLHDSSIMRLMEVIANLSIMRTSGTLDTWKAIFKGTRLKDNEVKQLVAISKGLSSKTLAKILPKCSEKVVLPSGKTAIKLNVEKMFDKIFNMISENAGVKYENSSELLKGWDERYFPYILVAQKALRAEDATLLNNMLKATFDGEYEKFLFEEGTPNGDLNVKTREAYKAQGLDFKQWMEFDGVRDVTLKTASEDASVMISNITKSIESDLSLMFANEKLSAGIKDCLQDSGFEYVDGQLRANGNAVIDKKSLKKLSENVIKFTKDNGKVMQNAGILDIRDHFNARLRVLSQATQVQGDENFTISLWKRDPKHDLFQGHYCQCCISLDGLNKRAIVHSLGHVVDNIVELKNSSGDTVGKAKVLWIKDNNTGKPAMLVNGFEITGSGMYNNQIRDAFTEYFKDYSKAVAGEEVPIYTGICSYQKIVLDDLSDYSSNINMLGAYPNNTYHLDAFNADYPGSWPTELDKAKDLKMKVLYNPE